MQTRQQEDGSLRVQLAGRLDGAGVEEISPKLSEAVQAATGDVVIDLSRVTFLASVGIRMLLVTARTLRRKGASLSLLDPQPLVREVVRITGIDSMIPVLNEADAPPMASGA